VGNPVGVTYTKITGPDSDVTEVFPNGSGLVTGLAPGLYKVWYEVASGYEDTTDYEGVIEITIGEYDGECGEVDDDCDTTSTASLGVVNLASVPADDECPDDDKVKLCHATQGANPFTALEISVQAAFNGHVDPPSNKDDHATDIIPPFDYKVQGVTTHFGGLNWPYGDPPSAEELVEWIAFWEAGCVDLEEVTPGAQAVDEDCENLLPVSGYIEITGDTVGVDYWLTGPGGAPVIEDPLVGTSGPLAPGDYEVHFKLDGGLTTNVANPIELTIEAFDGDCQLDEHPPVIPIAVQGTMSCLGDSSYTLSNDLGDADAVLWTVNGNDLGIPLTSPTSFTVTSPGTYIVHAEPNAPEFGFVNGTDQDWEFIFERPANCDLATLALTGNSPNAFIGGAMVLILTGLAMFSIRATRREKMSLI
jgi:hypothetical protein